MAITIACTDDIRNVFTRAQHNLDKEFKLIDTIRGAWEGRVRSGGNFPIGTGYAQRITTLGSERMQPDEMRWLPMVGLQDDCVTTCVIPSQEVNVGNADHVWYRVFSHAQHTQPFCLEKMLSEALNLPAQVRNILMNLKRRTVDVLDEFYRSNTMALASHRWLGIDDGTNSGQIRDGVWRFEQDANGTVNINKIILNAGIDPNNIALPSVSMLNWIREFGSYDGAFPLEGNVPIMADFEIASELPKYDTNVRGDNRYRQPGALDPSLAGVDAYAGYRWNRDPFLARYFWDVDDPNYPNGVLTRINHWTSREVSEGCVTQANTDFMNGDFTVLIFENPNVWEWQGYETPNPPEMPFEQPFGASGMWKFVNEVNEITPCNSQRALAYWQMILKRAARPNMPSLGHIALVRRFNSRQVFKSCKGLTVPAGGSYDCTLTCPPLDHYPPALVTRTTCGLWNRNGICQAS